VIEEGCDGETASSETPSLLSYTSRGKALPECFFFVVHILSALGCFRIVKIFIGAFKGEEGHCCWRFACSEAAFLLGAFSFMEVSYKPPPVKVDLGFVQLGDFWQRRGDTYVEKHDGDDEHAKEANQEEVANSVESYKKYSNKAFLSPARADIDTCHERLQSQEQNLRNPAADSYTQEKPREEEEKNREEIPHGRSLLGQLTPKYRAVEHRKLEGPVTDLDESESSMDCTTLERTTTPEFVHNGMQLDGMQLPAAAKKHLGSFIPFMKEHMSDWVIEAQCCIYLHRYTSRSETNKAKAATAGAISVVTSPVAFLLLCFCLLILWYMLQIHISLAVAFGDSKMTRVVRLICAGA
jgi:hypothetical protein